MTTMNPAKWERKKRRLRMRKGFSTEVFPRDLMEWYRSGGDEGAASEVTITLGTLTDISS